MKISIITVVFNDKKNLESTVQSILLQVSCNYEYIIIDGGSTDGTVDVIEKYEKDLFYSCSEPDRGIYDAMNKGLVKSTGDYILFLNAGDTLPDNNTLQKVVEKIQKNNHPDFIYGDAYELDMYGNQFLRPSRITSHKNIGMFTHHQSMYYKRQLIQKYSLRYDTSLNIAADYKFTCQFLEHARSEIYIAEPLSVFLQGGLSELQWQTSMKEQIKVKQEILNMPFWKIYLIYFAQTVWHIIKNKMPWIYKIIRFKR